jgi:hypothetical protein
MAETKTQGKRSQKQAKTPEAEEIFFQSIAESLTQKLPDVSWGKMMSSPGIKYKDKLFAFYYDKTMVLRLGRAFKLESVGITDYSLLAPFKTKPPLLDWFRITTADQARWEELATIAYQIMAGK